MAKSSSSNSAAVAEKGEHSKKRKRSDADKEKPSKKQKQPKAPRYERIEAPSAVDASKLEDDDVELVLIRVPALVSAVVVACGLVGRRYASFSSRADST